MENHALSALTPANLLAQLFDGDPGACTDVPGFTVYRRNLMAAVTHALTISLPTLNRLVGDGWMATLAREYFFAHGRQVFDWGQWGESFPSWLEQQGLCKQYPYLADCARLDWSVHVASRAEDPRPDYDSFASLNHRQDLNVRLHFAPATQVVRSVFPIVAIYQAHQQNPEQPNFSQASTLLRRGQGQSALVWRQGLTTQVRVVSDDEWLWLDLLQGPCLAEILTDPAIDGSITFGDWLNQSIREQLVLGLL